MTISCTLGLLTLGISFVCSNIYYGIMFFLVLLDRPFKTQKCGVTTQYHQIQNILVLLCSTARQPIKLTKLCELKAEISVITESQWWWLSRYQMSMHFKVPLRTYYLWSFIFSLTFRRQTPRSLNLKYSIHPPSPQNISNLPSRATSLKMSQSIITVTQIGPTFPFPLNW